MGQITREQAIALATSRWWAGKSARDIVQFQLFESKLCMDFSDFHAAVEEALGRPVFTHEFAWPESLRAEFLGDKRAPTFEEIVELIPAEKRLIIGI